MLSCGLRPSFVSLHSNTTRHGSCTSCGLRPSFVSLHYEPVLPVTDTGCGLRPSFVSLHYRGLFRPGRSCCGLRPSFVSLHFPAHPASRMALLRLATVFRFATLPAQLGRNSNAAAACDRLSFRYTCPARCSKCAPAAACDRLSFRYTRTRADVRQSNGCGLRPSFVSLHCLTAWSMASSRLRLATVFRFATLAGATSCPNRSLRLATVFRFATLSIAHAMR